MISHSLQAIYSDSNADQHSTPSTNASAIIGLLHEKIMLSTEKQMHRVAITSLGRNIKWLCRVAVSVTLGGFALVLSVDVLVVQVALTFPKVFQQSCSSAPWSKRLRTSGHYELDIPATDDCSPDDSVYFTLAPFPFADGARGHPDLPNLTVADAQSPGDRIDQSSEM